ncbi:unnamed protein product [Dibothriocephalus latus]|uniref:Uncharacterized protein n=1 Tax=Dibothriocephalus latus TaxID=60516 RepID=A0A3P7L1Q5_DIBLA|nr:unnamed protein product [Dibothriocephalus latus]
MVVLLGLFFESADQLIDAQLLLCLGLFWSAGTGQGSRSGPAYFRNVVLLDATGLLVGHLIDLQAQPDGGKISLCAHLACVNSNLGPVSSLDVVYDSEQGFVHVIGTAIVSRGEDGEGGLEEEVEFFQFGLRLSTIGSVRRTAQSTVCIMHVKPPWPVVFPEEAAVLALFGKDGQMSIIQLGPSSNDTTSSSTSCVFRELARSQFGPANAGSEFVWPPKECILVPNVRRSDSLAEDNEQTTHRLWIHGKFLGTDFRYKSLGVMVSH